MTSDTQIIVIDPQPKQSIEDYIEHDLPPLIRKSSGCLLTDDHELVIVGRSKQPNQLISDTFRESGIGPVSEMRTIIKQIKMLGYDVFEEDIVYPRNAFLSFGNFLVGSKADDRYLTSGGVYVFGSDFVMASDNLVRSYTKPGVDKRKFLSKKSVENFWRAFGVEKVYFIPPSKKVPNYTGYCNIWQECIADLDFTLNGIARLNTFTVDKDQYKENRDIFQEISRENSTEFIPIESCKISNGSNRDRELWSNGYLVLGSKRFGKFRVDDYFKNVIFYNCLINQSDLFSMEEHFRKTSKKSAYVRYVETAIPIVSLPIWEGTLHCVTNTAPDRKSYESFRQMMRLQKDR